MNRRTSTIDLPLTQSVDTGTEYSVTLESAGKTYELPFQPNTVRSTGTIALKEVIQYEPPTPRVEEINEFVENGDQEGPALETPSGIEVDDQIVDTLTGLRRESMEGRNGPEYNNKGETHTEQEQIARYQDWVRGTGRMLDVAWDEGAVTDENMQEWLNFKNEVEKFHGINDFYALSDIGKLRGEVFAFVQRLGVAGKAFEAYDAATE